MKNRYRHCVVIFITAILIFQTYIAFGAEIVQVEDIPSYILLEGEWITGGTRYFPGTYPNGLFVSSEGSTITFAGVFSSFSFSYLHGTFSSVYYGGWRIYIDGNFVEYASGTTGSISAYTYTSPKLPNEYHVVKLETTRDLWSVANKWGIDYISVDGSFDQNYNGSALPPDTTPPEPEPELTMPTQVKNVRIEDITSTSATISWDLNSESENVLKYIVYLNGEKYGETTGTEYTISNLQPNTTYQVTVTAVNDLGEAPASEPCIFTTPEPEPAPQPIPPTQVKNVHVKNMTSTSVLVAWDPNPQAENITKYIIYLNGEKYGETEDIEYVIDGLKEGEKYTVTVAAVNDLGEGSVSEPITFTTSKIVDISNSIKVQDILSSIVVLFTNLWPLLAFALALTAIVPITRILKQTFRRRSNA